MINETTTVFSSFFEIIKFLYNLYFKVKSIFEEIFLENIMYTPRISHNNAIYSNEHF